MTNRIQSFRGARGASEPGIQKHIQCLRLDSGSGATRRPGMTMKIWALP
jgi:hypothetical protein